MCTVYIHTLQRADRVPILRGEIPMAGHWFEEFSVELTFEHEIRCLSVQDTTPGTTVANLGMTDTRFPSPVFHGDTVRSRTTLKEVRDSKSRPNAGIVTFLHQGFNQRNEEVCTCTRQALMLRKPGAK
jgi:hypothetical protein